MAKPTAEELELLYEFRQRIGTLELPETWQEQQNLLRWIRARDGNLKAAKRMLLDSLNWRKEFRTDQLLAWSPPEELVRECPLHIIGCDEDNFPVIFVPFGSWNLRKFAEGGLAGYGMQYTVHYLESFLEKMKGQMTPAGVPVTQVVIILDVQDLSYWTLANFGVADMIINCAKTAEDNYPEMILSVYVINAGAVFATFYAFVKPLLPPRTVLKLHIYTNSKKWLPVLSHKIPPALLHPYVGGCKAE